MRGNKNYIGENMHIHEKNRFTNDEKSAIDKGLKSINDGKVSSSEEILNSIKEKYPNL